MSLCNLPTEIPIIILNFVSIFDMKPICECNKSLYHKANPYIYKQGIPSLLFRASNRGHERIVALLYSLNDVNINEESTQRAFCHAAVKGHTGLVSFIPGAGIVTIDTKDREGCTALMWAAKSGQQEVGAMNGHDVVAQAVFASGLVDVNAKDIIERRIRGAYSRIGEQTMEIYCIMINP